jgi:hypothetical protein
MGSFINESEVIRFRIKYLRGTLTLRSGIFTILENVHGKVFERIGGKST